MLANQNADWQTICSTQGRALTECADNAVPHLRELKQGCAAEIAQYRQCLETNGAMPDDQLEQKCGGLMKRVWECSERTMNAIQQGAEGAEAKASGGAGERRLV